MISLCRIAYFIRSKNIINDKDENLIIRRTLFITGDEEHDEPICGRACGSSIVHRGINCFILRVHKRRKNYRKEIQDTIIILSIFLLQFLFYWGACVLLHISLHFQHPIFRTCDLSGQLMPISFSRETEVCYIYVANISYSSCIHLVLEFLSMLLLHCLHLSPLCT